MAKNQSPKETYFYIEYDGRVFLINKGRIKRFPSSKEEIPFRIRKIRKMAFSDVDVFYCEPMLPNHPEGWILKDDILVEDNADTIVKKAVCYSYVRHVCHGIIEKNGKVLMVKASRGYTKGFWNLPGGFAHYGEDPKEALEREIKEETGLSVKARRLVGIYTETFEDGFYMISFMYECDVKSGREMPSETEIEEIRYMGAKAAIKAANSPFVKKGLKDFLLKMKSSPTS